MCTYLVWWCKWCRLTLSIVRCPSCASVEDKVIDSRSADDGSAIRRRRECLGCARRFTTYERVEESPVVVIKRNGVRQVFDRSKVLAGLHSATKNLPISHDVLDMVATDVEEAIRLEGPEVQSERVGLAVLERLRYVDAVAYIRFASVYKGFTDLNDFTREVKLMGKNPKSPPASAG
jgi:transcriptional repressor NrdR